MGRKRRPPARPSGPPGTWWWRASQHPRPAAEAVAGVAVQTWATNREWEFMLMIVDVDCWEQTLRCWVVINAIIMAQTATNLPRNWRKQLPNSCQETFRRPPHEHQLWPLLQPHRLGCLLLRRWDSKGFPTKPDHLLGGKHQSSEIPGWGSSWCKHAPLQLSLSPTEDVELYNLHVYVCVYSCTHTLPTSMYVRCMG